MKSKPVTCEYLKASTAGESNHHAQTLSQFASHFDSAHSIEFISPSLIHIKHGTNFNMLVGTTHIYTDLTKQPQQKAMNILNSIML